jgi:hypothetical protein
MPMQVVYVLALRAEYYFHCRYWNKTVDYFTKTVWNNTNYKSYRSIPYISFDICIKSI